MTPLDADPPVRPTEVVEVVLGPFRSYRGVVRQVYVRTGRAVVDLNMFGRTTPTDLPVSHLKRVL